MTIVGPIKYLSTRLISKVGILCTNVKAIWQNSVSEFAKMNRLTVEFTPQFCIFEGHSV